MLRLLLAFTLALALPGEELKLQVLATADTHAAVMPEDPYTLQAKPKGWARLAPLVRELQARNPHTLLVDVGDTIQGEPIAYVRHRVHPELPDPGTAILNALGAHAMVVGNHDFDFGLSTLRQVEEQAKHPWLAANVVDAGRGKPAFTPYAVVEVKGLRVAILGLANSALERLVEADRRPGLKVLDAVETARAWVPRLRDQEKADLVIVAIHGGLGDGSATPGAEHQARALAEQVKGIDLVLAGHSHVPVATRCGGVPVLQPAAHAAALGIAELTLQKAKGRWSVTACELRGQAPAADAAPDPEVLKLTEALRRHTDAYLDTPAAALETPLDGRWSRMEDSAVLQLIHRVQRQATGAELSFAASPRSRYYVPRGPVSIRQLWPLAAFEDRVARLRLTGAQVRAWLEHGARFYAFCHEPQLYNPAVAPWDFDLLDGLDFTLDLSRPVGHRVTRLLHRGKPVSDQQSFTVAVSSRRLTGAGGFLEAVGFRGEPEAVTPQSLRNLLFEYALARPSLELPLRNAWRIVPWLERERVLAQQPD